MNEPAWLVSFKSEYPGYPLEFYVKRRHQWEETRRAREELEAHSKTDVHNDVDEVDELGDDASDDPHDESMDPMEESGCTKSVSSDDEEDEEEIDELVLEDMQKFEESFRGITKRYKLLNRIGEGTFSTVYKAEDLLYDHYNNDWDIEAKWSPSGKRKEKRAHHVAIKKIYVTSSPIRIMNELDLLHDLRGCDAICPLITAFRHQDQVIAVLPYFRHLDFRAYFREFTVDDMRPYFRCLFKALAAVHEHGILHRDIKPTNFLYNPHHKHGVLVDFGLAERECHDTPPCLCQLSGEQRRAKITKSYWHTQGSMNGYPTKDNRHSIRANRAGTRGFRAPEVLFKCTRQTTTIDTWSAGVILLTILARRFPFFHSADDIDAVIELATVFGRNRMKLCALLHGQVFECNLPTITENGYTMEKIIMWSTNRPSRDSAGNKLHLPDNELEAVSFLNKCFDLDPHSRMSAEDALSHPFLTADLRTADSHSAESPIDLAQD